MTAAVLQGFWSFTWPFKTFAQQVQQVGIATIEASVWRQHMHDAVWPDGTAADLRAWRLFTGLVSGFWPLWLVSGGRRSATESLPLWTLLYLMGISLLAMIFVPGPEIIFRVAFGVFLVAALGMYAITSFSEDTSGSPISRLQTNWFYKYPRDFYDLAGAGPMQIDIPDRIRDRLKLAEQQGWSWKIAWTDTDPLAFVYPPFQPWRKVCVGGWDTANRRIDNV